MGNMSEDDILRELGMSNDDTSGNDAVTQDVDNDIDFDMLGGDMPAASQQTDSALIDTTGGSQVVNKTQLKGIQVPITIEVGRTTMTLAEIENLHEGTVVGIGKKVDEPMYLSCQGKRIAEAEILDMEGELHVVVSKLLTN